MPMDRGEAERFGGLSARVDALKERVDNLEDRKFTAGQTGIMVMAIVLTAGLSAAASIAVLAFGG